MNKFLNHWLILWMGVVVLFIVLRANWFLSEERDREFRRDE